MWGQVGAVDEVCDLICFCHVGECGVWPRLEMGPLYHSECRELEAILYGSNDVEDAFRMLSQGSDYRAPLWIDCHTDKSGPTSYIQSHPGRASRTRFDSLSGAVFGANHTGTERRGGGLRGCEKAKLCRGERVSVLDSWTLRLDLNCLTSQILKKPGIKSGLPRILFFVKPPAKSQQGNYKPRTSRKKPCSFGANLPCLTISRILAPRLMLPSS